MSDLNLKIKIDDENQHTFATSLEEYISFWNNLTMFFIYYQLQWSVIEENYTVINVGNIKCAQSPLLTFPCSGN